MNSYFHLVQNILSSQTLPTNYALSYKAVVLFVALCGLETVCQITE
jgi:hypothetical protein